MDWDKLRIFHAVTAAGSFTHAGDKLNLSQSAISRQIATLEQELNVPLYHRHARGLLLTEQGEELYKTVCEVFDKLTRSRILINESKNQAAGHLAITTTTGFGGCWLIPRLHVFASNYPTINMSLILTDNDLDLSMREADIAIRMHPPLQGELVQRHLRDFSLPIFASPDYLRQYGKPSTLQEISKHRLVLFSEKHPSIKDINWLASLIKKKLRKSEKLHYLKVNNMSNMARAIANGLGIGSIPSYTANHYPDLVQILPEIKTPKIKAYFVYPEELRHSKRVEVFRDFLTQELNIE